jgi:hypothetical protein
MADTKQVPPEELILALTISLWDSRTSLRALARRKKWEPSIEDFRAIAERQVERLKLSGVLHVTRRVTPVHSMRPGVAAPPAAVALPIWRARPTED